MSDKSQKLIKIALTAGAAAVGIIGVGLIVKYHKNIIQKLSRSRARIFERVNVPRPFAVEIVNNPIECQDVVKRLRQHLNEDLPVLGFDVEWVTVNNDRRKIALIQLCSSLGLCALIRVCKFPKIPLELRMLLEDPEIIKAGVTPISDAKYLMEDYAIQMNGTFDLRFLAMMSQHKAQGLGSLSKAVIGIELDKDWRVRCSDWEIDVLSNKQIEYASNDAFVAIEIFRKLFNIIKPGHENAEDIRKFCDGYTDMTFKNKMAQMNLDSTNVAAHEKKLLKKGNDLTKMLKRSYSTRNTPLYHNCRLEAPDGELLCTCDQKKAKWYVEKGLGAEISQDPYTVRLNFEPAGRAVGEVGEYYRSVKENRCVVCGKQENLIRKNIVPREYRKFFPNVMKDKTSHDVLLLCILCHQRSNISDLKMRQKLQDKCDAPLIGDIPESDLEAAKKLKYQQRAARALYNGDKIPESRKEELKKILEENFPGQEIDEEFCRNLLTKEPQKSNPFAPSHGEMVVQRFKETEGLVNLEKLWRQHFLDFMEPTFLPELWNVNHNGNRLEIRATEGRVEADDLKIAGVEAVIAPRKEPTIVVTSSPLNHNNNNNIETLATSREVSKSESTPSRDANDSKNAGLDVTADEDPETSSDWDFRSAAGSRASRFDPNRTLTEDDRYFSDATSVQSFYETIRSDGSTIDDFHSFASSLTERPDYDSDDNSRTSFCSQDLSIDSDTEVEDDPSAKMEL